MIDDQKKSGRAAAPSRTLRQYQVDAFAERPFSGNPAAVCALDAWPDDSLLQAIAEENNLSETAFFVPSAKAFTCACFRRDAKSICADMPPWRRRM